MFLFCFFTLIVVGKGIFGSGLLSCESCVLLAYILFSDRENRNVSYSDNGYLTIYAVILLVQLFPEAQRETTVAATNGFYCNGGSLFGG